MPTYRACWNGVVIVESEYTVRVGGGSEYFPPESLDREFFTDSRTAPQCPWKGLAMYYTVTVDGAANPDAGWYYPQPSPAAESIRDHVAFWNGVMVARVADSDPEATQSGAFWRSKLNGR